MVKLSHASSNQEFMFIWRSRRCCWDRLTESMRMWRKKWTMLLITSKMTWAPQATATLILIYYLRTNHSILVFWRFGYYWWPLLKRWGNRVKIKNSDWFSSITWGLTILYWFFVVSVSIGDLCWWHGGIELKSKIGIDSHLLLED